MILIGSKEVGRRFGVQTIGNRDEASLLSLRRTGRLKWPFWLILEQFWDLKAILVHLGASHLGSSWDHFGSFWLYLAQF